MSNEAIQEGESSGHFAVFSSQNSKFRYTYNKIREVK
ncbi:site-specific integrase, partial [Mesorhizobium sp. M4B.F.Ca.ET.172.01.1.1]